MDGHDRQNTDRYFMNMLPCGVCSLFEISGQSNILLTLLGTLKLD